MHFALTVEKYVLKFNILKVKHLTPFRWFIHQQWITVTVLYSGSAQWCFFIHSCDLISNFGVLEMLLYICYIIFIPMINDKIYLLVKGLWRCQDIQYRVVIWLKMEDKGGDYLTKESQSEWYKHITCNII